MSVPAGSPVASRDSGTAPAPKPALASKVGTRFPYDVVVPQSKWNEAPKPRGSIVALSVAVLIPTFVAGFVATTGVPLYSNAPMSGAGPRTRGFPSGSAGPITWLLF